MANLQLNYYGSDYTPLKDNENNTFDFKVNGTTKSAQNLRENKNKQYLILESFLKYAQKNISSFTMIKDSDIKDCKLYNYHEQKMYFDGLVGVISIKDFVPFPDSDKYDITLQINSRLDCGENQDKSKIKPYFFSYNIIATTIKNRFCAKENIPYNDTCRVCAAGGSMRQ